MRITPLLKFVLGFLLFVALPVHALTLLGATSTRSTAQTWRGPTAADYDFTLTSTSSQTYISGGSTTTNTVNDAVIQTYTGATYDNSYLLNVTPVNGFSVFPVYTSLDPGVATVDQNGVISRVSDGTVRVNVASGNYFLTKRFSGDVSRTTELSVMTFLNYVTGSAGLDVSTETDALIASKSFSTTTTYLYSFESSTGASYTYNPNNILTSAGINVTAISPLNSRFGIRANAVAVTQQDILRATHFGGDGGTGFVGTVVTFVCADNSVYTRTITAGRVIGTTDIEIDHLDTALPGCITPVKLLPENYLTYFPSVSNTVRLPVVAFVQGAFNGTHNRKQMFIGELSQLTSATRINQPLSTPRLNWFITVLDGDSSNPVFMIVNGRLNLLNTWQSSSGGPFTTSNITGINSALSSMSSAYRIATSSLAGFNTYP